MFDWFCKRRDPYLIETLPSIFQRAANCPKKESQAIERLLMMAWLSRITAWKAKTTYLDARYPPPLLPPVLSRTITWINCASEKSILAVPAHCKRKMELSLSPPILKIEGRKGVSENCLVTCPTMLNLKATEVNKRQKELRSVGVHDLIVLNMKIVLSNGILMNSPTNSE